MNNVAYLCVRALVTTIFLVFMVVVCAVGGVFNRMRGGGFFDLGALNETYWALHLSERAIMAIPTAFLVLLIGFNVRGSFVTGLFTWTSLFIGWGTYMAIGSNPNDYCSRLGVFDWVLGRPVGWTHDHTRRFIREFTGMSLRGLLWTLPAGYLLYLLDFGWQYSLSGSQMGLYYYLGGIIPDPDYSPSSHFWVNFVGLIPHSELMWGAFIWYVLFVSCMVELIKRRRYQLEQRYQGMDLQLNSELFRCCANDCLSSKCISFMYQLCVVFIVVISLCSVVYYAAVEQADLLNKMQTFTGLFIGTVCLVLALGCSWGYWCGRWTARQRQDHAPRENPAPRPERYSLLLQRDDARLDDSDAHDRPADYGAIRQEVVAANIVEDGQAARMVGVRYALGVRQIPQNQLRVLERMRILDYYWILFETVFYLDVFAVMHFFNGLVFALSTVAVIVMTCVCFVWNINTPRYYVGECNNTGAAF